MRDSNIKVSCSRSILTFLHRMIIVRDLELHNYSRGYCVRDASGTRVQIGTEVVHVVLQCFWKIEFIL